MWRREPVCARVRCRRQEVVDRQQGPVDCTYFDVPKTATIEVKKTLVSAPNPGRFDLTIGSTTFENSGNGYGDGGTTGAQTLAIGSYGISEATHSGTNGSFYTSFYVCTDNQAPLTSGNGTIVTGGVTLDDGDSIVYGGDAFYLASPESTSNHECFTTVQQPWTRATVSGASQPTPTGTV
jgi:hypothetical protein